MRWWARSPGAASVSVEDLMKVADEAAQIMEYSSQLEAKSAELERTARQLREANEKLTQLSIQKDAFLSQISHELRTPMTSIRAFSEILMGSERMKVRRTARYSRIIHDESRRLTRLLDDLLDLSVLENGKVSLRLETLSLSDGSSTARSTPPKGRAQEPGIRIRPRRGAEAVPITTDPDRLAQVFINVISNAQKYCTADRPELWHPRERAPATRDGRLHRQRSGHPAFEAGPDLREVLAPDRHPRRGRARGSGSPSAAR
jgi:signal transduction histidine kinase